MTNNARPGAIEAGAVVAGGHDQRTATDPQSLGEILRDLGIAQAEENTDAWWRSCCDAAIAHLATRDVPFSADHVLELIPAPDHPNRIGARFHAAVRAGVITPCGYVLSDRPSRRRGVQRLYRGGGAR